MGTKDDLQNKKGIVRSLEVDSPRLPNKYPISELDDLCITTLSNFSLFFDV